jgi:hypothetical protein
MPTEQEIDDYRNRLTARFKREYDEAKTQQASIDAQLVDLDVKLERLKTEVPNGACYRCYYDNGVISAVVGAPPEPTAPGTDRFRCANGHDL